MKEKTKKVVPMGLPGVENVPAPRESIFTLSRGSQLPYNKKNKHHKIKKIKEIKNYPDTNVKQHYMDDVLESRQ